MNGVFTAQTGGPLSIQYSNAGLNAPFINNRPNVNGPVEIYGKVKSGSRPGLTRAHFRRRPTGRFGNVGRNVLTGPDLVNVDFSLFRKFRFREQVSLELRGEWFNMTNTPHFNNPGHHAGEFDVRRGDVGGERFPHHATGREVLLLNPNRAANV